MVRHRAHANRPVERRLQIRRQLRHLFAHALTIRRSVLHSGRCDFRIRLLTALLCGVFIAGLSAADLLPSERFQFRAVTVPYTTGALFVLPLEQITVAMTARQPRLFSVDAPQGALTATGPNTWTWKAPAEKGRYPIEVHLPDKGKVVDFNAFVMVPAAEVRNGFLNGYQIGSYPAKPLNGNKAYIPPAGFVEVTSGNEDTRVSPNFRLKQFLTKQKSGYPKYLVLDERLVLALEIIGRNLEPLGWNAGDIFVMSGYRTPFYNKAIGDTEFSMHQWGRASDIFLDKNHDGVMDDFNRDRAVNRADAADLAAFVEDLLKTPELSGLIGGIGIYDATAAHGPFVHVDTRPWKARW